MRVVMYRIKCVKHSRVRQYVQLTQDNIITSQNNPNVHTIHLLGEAFDEKRHMYNNV